MECQAQSLDGEGIDSHRHQRTLPKPQHQMGCTCVPVSNSCRQLVEQLTEAEVLRSCCLNAVLYMKNCAMLLPNAKLTTRAQHNKVCPPNRANSRYSTTGLLCKEHLQPGCCVSADGHRCSKLSHTMHVTALMYVTRR